MHPDRHTDSSFDRCNVKTSHVHESNPFITENINRKQQAKSKGLLELTVLISGDHRRRNVPGAAFQRGKKMLLSGARALVSPVVSSPSSSIVAVDGQR